MLPLHQNVGIKVDEKTSFLWSLFANARNCGLQCRLSVRHFLMSDVSLFLFGDSGDHCIIFSFTISPHSPRSETRLQYTKASTQHRLSQLICLDNRKCWNLLQAWAKDLVTQASHTLTSYEHDGQECTSSLSKDGRQTSTRAGMSRSGKPPHLRRRVDSLAIDNIGTCEAFLVDYLLARPERQALEVLRVQSVTSRQT